MLFGILAVVVLIVLLCNYVVVLHAGLENLNLSTYGMMLYTLVLMVLFAIPGVYILMSVLG